MLLPGACHTSTCNTNCTVYNTPASLQDIPPHLVSAVGIQLLNSTIEGIASEASVKEWGNLLVRPPDWLCRQQHKSISCITTVCKAKLSSKPINPLVLSEEIWD